MSWPSSPRRRAAGDGASSGPYDNPICAGTASSRRRGTARWMYRRTRVGDLIDAADLGIDGQGPSTGARVLRGLRARMKRAPRCSANNRPRNVCVDAGRRIGGLARRRPQGDGGDVSRPRVESLHCAEDAHRDCTRHALRVPTNDRAPKPRSENTQQGKITTRKTPRAIIKGCGGGATAEPAPPRFRRRRVGALGGLTR